MNETEMVCELACGGRRWAGKLFLRHINSLFLHDRYASPADPNDDVYHGSIVVAASDNAGDLPSDGDLVGDILILRMLPKRGDCRTGELQVRITTSNVKRSLGGDSVAFDFDQLGGKGHR